jgi:ribosomal protein S14
VLFLRSKEVINIQKSCKHCGRIHEEDYICPKKPPKPPKISKPTEQYILRSTYRWGQTREAIRKRDMYLCQVCLREGVYNCDDIEVHHAVKINDNKDLAFEPGNLITLCREHHEMADNGDIPISKIKEIISEQERQEANDTKRLFLCEA